MEGLGWGVGRLQLCMYHAPDLHQVTDIPTFLLAGHIAPGDWFRCPHASSARRVPPTSKETKSSNTACVPKNKYSCNKYCRRCKLAASLKILNCCIHRTIQNQARQRPISNAFQLAVASWIPLQSGVRTRLQTHAYPSVLLGHCGGITVCMYCAPSKGKNSSKPSPAHWASGNGSHRCPI